MDVDKARELIADVTTSGDFGSNCCDAKMYEFGDDYICADCKDHCEPARDN